MAKARNYTFFDDLCMQVDQLVRALTNQPKSYGKKYPARSIDDQLSQVMMEKSAALMRINHAGEICAQALYQGQALMSSNPATAAKLKQAALEEGDHLAWCSQRLEELQSHTSYLNPVWYMGSLMIGIAAGIAGDDWSLGFVAETEKQVSEHLKKHMVQLASHDPRSYEIVAQMEQDESQHRATAIRYGAKELPTPIKKAMAFTAKIMVKTSYWV